MKKILIADDQLEIRELIKLIFRIKNYHIFTAKSGREAIEVAKTEIPDLIIMDIKMSGEIDGLEATQILKNDPETKNCSIILMSGKDQREEIEKGYEAGASGYFVKPFDPDDLIKKVEEILE